MRKIEYIFIDSDTQAHSSNSGRHDVSNLRYHYIVNQWSNEHNASSLEHCRVTTEVGTANNQGLVIRPTDIQLTTKLINGPIYDPDKYNKCSIFIHYCGSLRPAAWLLEPAGTLNPATSNLKQRQALISLLVELRRHFPDAKILGLSEIDSKEPYSRNIIVSDAMNVLRRKLSDYP